MTEREPLAPEPLFERLAVRLLADPAVTPGTGFGSALGLRVGGKIFAMVRGGDLVVKLPKDQVDRLVESGIGVRFAARRDGRAMREWISIAVGYRDQWEPLTRQALEFVRPAS
jgi:hypothetical protein